MNETVSLVSEAEMLFNYWQGKLAGHFNCIIGEGDDSPVKIAVYFSDLAMVMLSNQEKFKQMAHQALLHKTRLNQTVKTHIFFCVDRSEMFTISYGWFYGNGAFVRIAGLADDYPLRMFKRSLDHVFQFINSSLTNFLTIENNKPVIFDILTEYPDYHDALRALRRR